VCYFITRYAPVFSGQALQLERIGKELAKKGVDFFVVSYRFKGLSRQETLDGVKIYRIDPTLPGKLGTLVFNVKSFILVWRLRGSFDLLHVHSIAVGKYAAMLAAKMLRKKAVFEMTLLGSDDPVSIVEHSPLPSLEMALFRMFDRYFAISEALAERYVSIGLPGEKLRRLAKGVDTDIYSPAEDKAGLRRKLGLPEERPLVIFVGAVMKRKGVDVLMEAWRKVASRDERPVLLVVGPDSFDEAQSHLNEFARKTKEAAARLMPGRVVFMGMTDRVHEYLKASDIYVFPSRAEGMPASPLEAMSCGLPCVLAPMGGIAYQVAEDGESGIIVRQDDPDALADAVLRLLEDPARAARLGRSARKRALERFSVGAAAEDLIRHYRELLGREGEASSGSGAEA